MDPEALLPSRVQFAFVVTFHILFPAFTIGLAAYLAVLEGLWLRTKQSVYLDLYRLWVRIFAVSFGMGVVSGIVMSFQFGTNWSRFSEATMPVLGPLLGYEVVTAFFLEATFLGIMLFGRRLVPPMVHFASTVLVAIGTSISAFWILSANSWMQTPAGYRLENGIFRPENWVEIIFNPSFANRFAHMMLAAFLTTAFVVLGVAAYYLMRRMWESHAKIMMQMAVGLILVLAPVQIIAGHSSGEQLVHTQPAKLAAMEGIWEGGPNQPFLVFAWPDQENERNLAELAIPNLGSLVVGGRADAALPGLKDVPPEDRPPVAAVFWTFRIMVAIGLAMVGMGVIGVILLARGRLTTTGWFRWLAVAMAPSGFIAVVTGWYTAEIGRQPWVVFGLMRTADATSPVPADSVSLTLLLFFVAYTIVFSAGTYYVIRLIRSGPPPDEPAFGEAGPGTPMRPLSKPEASVDGIADGTADSPINRRRPEPKGVPT